MTTTRDYIIMLEMIHCPNSTDGGGEQHNHSIDSANACTICDRAVRALVIQHGLDA